MEGVRGVLSGLCGGVTMPFWLTLSSSSSKPVSSKSGERLRLLTTESTICGVNSWVTQPRSQRASTPSSRATAMRTRGS